MSRYAKDGSIWLNAKAARSAARKPKAKNDGAAEKPAAGGEAGKPAKSSRPRARRKELGVRFFDPDTLLTRIGANAESRRVAPPRRGGIFGRISPFGATLSAGIIQLDG